MPDLECKVYSKKISDSDPNVPKFSGAAVKVFHPGDGSIVVMVNNEREKYAFAPGEWTGYDILEVEDCAADDEPVDFSLEDK